MQSYKSHEIGVYESAQKLLGFPYYRFSDQVKWLNTYLPEERRGRLLDIYELQKLNPESTQLFHTNLINDYYPNRPDCLEHLNLYDLDSWYDYKTQLCNHAECSSFIIKRDLGFFHKRTKPKVIKTAKIKLINQEAIEKYYFQLLFLFKPWRNEIKDLKENFNSYQEAFNSFNNINNLSQNLSLTRFTSQRKQIEEAQKQSEKLKEKVSLIKQPTNPIGTNKSQSVYFKKLLDLGVNEINNNVISNDNLESSIANLNSEQKQIYDEIIDQIEHQNQHMQLKCNCDNKPIRMFCSGVAGMCF